MIRLPDKRPGQPILTNWSSDSSPARIDELARQLGAKVSERIDGLDVPAEVRGRCRRQVSPRQTRQRRNVERVDSNFPRLPNRTDRLALSSPQATSLRPSVSSDKTKW